MSQEACCAEIYGGKCRTLISEQAFCGSLRSRNAHGRVKRGIMRRNLQHIGRSRMVSPRLNPGFHRTLTVRTPSVWPLFEELKTEPTKTPKLLLAKSKSQRQMIGGLEHVLFFHSFGNVIIPIDSYFSLGFGQPPTRYIEYP